MAADANGSLGARILIMLYGLGIVALGSYPIQQEYGSVLNFLLTQVKKIGDSIPFEEWKRMPKRNAGLVPPDSIGALGVTARRIQEGGRPAPAHAQSAPSDDKDLDGLTSTDKKQLDSLLKNLE